jgi:tRNA G10  N-methylase Trm11
VAAALCRLAGVQEDDVVWDPFVGSALELCERARLGPYVRLIGTDLEDDALSAAAENLASAGLADVALVRADARTYRPAQRPSLILTNPPMGRRVARDGDLSALCCDFIAHAGRVLAPGGRLAWLSPMPRQTIPAARAAGLRLMYQKDVDMGGFGAEMQLLVRPG